LLRVQQEETLRKYEGIWASYQAKYESFEKARKLQKMQEELQLLENQSESPSGESTGSWLEILVCLRIVYYSHGIHESSLHGSGMHTQ